MSASVIKLCLQVVSWSVSATLPAKAARVNTYTPAHTRSKLEYVENLKKARNRILPKIENAARAGARAAADH